MINGNSKKHGMTKANLFRPKSKQWKRRNKALGKARGIALYADLRDALLKGNV